MPFRTDLAAELVAQAPPLPGLEQQEESFGSLRFHTVQITQEQTAQRVGKPMGTYVTVTTPPFEKGEEITEEELIAIAQRMADLLPDKGLILVVGLGNNDITPDAIGPRTVHQILATRHIGEELKKQAGLEQLRPVAVLAPGVLGQTGIETSEIIGALVKNVHPAAVVVVDALAAREASRLGNTIQIANTGICPGSGVQNSRKEISQSTLGVPVVSVGVPTVIDATSLASDLLQGDEDVERCRMLFEPRGTQLMITPREIDNLISHACKTLSLALNKALQPEMTLEEIGYLAG
ncbi:MAG: GPR endopeptidase [Oscillospiraceae bacterium]|jgi:spore protease